VRMDSFFVWVSLALLVGDSMSVSELVEDDIRSDWISDEETCCFWVSAFGMVNPNVTKERLDSSVRHRAVEMEIIVILFIFSNSI